MKEDPKAGQVSAKGKRLSRDAWDQIRAKYEHGQPVDSIAKEHDVTARSIFKKANRDSWNPHGSLREEATREVLERVKEEAKENFYEVVTKANATQRKLNAYGVQTGYRLLEQLNKNFEARKYHAQKAAQKAADKAGMPIEPYEVPLGNLHMVYRTVMSEIREIAQFDRQIIGADLFNPNADDGSSVKTAHERLTDIFAESLRLHSELMGGTDVEETEAPVHAEVPAGEQGSGFDPA